MRHGDRSRGGSSRGAHRGRAWLLATATGTLLGCSASSGSSSGPSPPPRVSPAEPATTALDRARETTYLNEMLAGRAADLLVRWDEAVDSVVGVYEAPSGAVPGYRATHGGALRRAIDAWNSIGLPVSLRMVSDSAQALVWVTWIARFASTRSGETRVATDAAHGWIEDVTLVLSTHNPSGRPLRRAQVEQACLHEVGHALGLGHSPHPGDVMSPENRNLALSDRDRETARLLYALPPGRIR